MTEIALSPGLYVLRRPWSRVGFEHVGILDVGNYLRQPGSGPWARTVVHLDPGGIRFEEFTDAAGWTVARQITDVAGAVDRLASALAHPTYDLVLNNCEHFVEYIANGVRRSPQVRGVIAIAAVVGVTVWLLRRKAA